MPDQHDLVSDGVDRLAHDGCVSLQVTEYCGVSPDAGQLLHDLDPVTLLR
jgi:hypothetical protein